MEYSERILILKNKIWEELSVLINNDYVLWDCPYYSNIGDTLIWEGERTFLKELGYRCLGYASDITCTFPKLPSNVIILLQGGGNFGDLWRRLQDFRLKVIRYYPHNRIVIFPQSVYYQDITLMQEDARVMAEHKDVTICVRDTDSYELIKNNFKNPVLLVPDMAFYISSAIIARYKRNEGEKVLFLKRTDKELVSASYSIEEKESSVEIRDWPTIEKTPLFMVFLYKLLGLCSYLEKLRMLKNALSWFTNVYAVQLCRPLLLKRGIGFISAYKFIYTTRLHVMILSILLGKECSFFDNSYGKNVALYNTWLKNLTGVKQGK